jgi:hypothetical protein
MGRVANSFIKKQQRIRDNDDVTYHVLQQILEHEIGRESEIESVLVVDWKRYLHTSFFVTYRDDVVKKIIIFYFLFNKISSRNK